MGPENDKCYAKYNQNLDRYYIGKDEKVIVIESSDEEVEENQQLTWMRLIKSQKNKLKQKEQFI